MQSGQTISKKSSPGKMTVTAIGRIYRRLRKQHFSKWRSNAKPMFRFRAVCFLLFLLGPLLLTPSGSFRNAHGSESGEIAIVVTENLNFRQAPRLSAPSLRKLKKGTRLEILARQNGWLKVRLNDLTGYVSHQKRYIRIEAQRPSATADGATPDGQERRDRYEHEIKDIERNLQSRQESLQNIVREEKSILNRLDVLDRSIDKGKKRLSAYEKELDRINKRITAYAETRKKLEKKIRILTYYNTRRLVALYKINWTGKIDMLASAGSVYEMIERKSALEKILAYDERNRLQLMNHREELKNLLADLNRSRTRQQAVESAQKKQMADLIRERSDRHLLLASIRGKKSLEREAITALQASAEALQRELMALKTERESSAPVIKSSDKSFRAYKGLLSPPVKGKIIHFFGPYTIAKFNAKNFRSGIDIQAVRGTPIKAVNAGVVIFSSWFKGYGNMMVIDHGSSYYTVYAHLEDVYKIKGDTVENREAIGTVGDGGSMIGPKLYFEIRHHGKALDPMDWLKG